MIIDSCGGGEGGTATASSSINAIDYMPGVMMHELGHNLGLDHGITLEVNHIGVMGAISLRSSQQDCEPNERLLDYQRFPVAPLDESALSETGGLDAPGFEAQLGELCATWSCPAGSQFANGVVSSAPADENVDWNCSSFLLNEFEAGTVAVDVNGDGDDSAPNDVLPATQPEWPLLDYSSSGVIGP